MRVNDVTVYLVASQKGTYLFTNEDQAKRTQLALLELSSVLVDEDIQVYQPGELEEISYAQGERINWVNKATQRRR
jgi:hypothetical protein